MDPCRSGRRSASERSGGPTGTAAWIAFATLAIFAPQILFVPLMQGAINRSTASRVRVLREVSTEIVGPDDQAKRRIDSMETHIERVFELNMQIFKLKFSMNFLMNLCSHLQIIAALLVGGWFVVTDRLAIGGVVAFISAIGRLNDPWGDLVNYFRDMNSAQVKFRLVADAIDRLCPPRSTVAKGCNGNSESTSGDLRAGSVT